MAKKPRIGTNLDDEEKQIIEALEYDAAVFVSRVTPTRKKEKFKPWRAQRSIRCARKSPCALRNMI